MQRPAFFAVVETPSPRVSSFIDMVNALSDQQWRVYAASPEGAYLMARLKYGPDEPVPFEQMDMQLELAMHYPHPIEHYRTRAEESRRWRQELPERLAASVPFKISAGACR